MSHVVVVGVATALLMAAALAGCPGRQAAAAPADAAEPISVNVGTVAMTDVATAIDSGGVVEARTTATITARILAPVREVLVSPGDRVRAGQRLIVLDGDDLAAGARAARSAASAAEQGLKAAAAELMGAEAGLTLARASHDRIASLQATQSATAQELDDVTATLRSAEARVAGASARALQAASAIESARAAGDQASIIDSFTTIAAPFEGLITENMVEPGNMASPGMPLLRLEDTRGFRLEDRTAEERVARQVPTHEACRRATATGAHRRQVAGRDFLQERSRIDLVRSRTAAQAMRIAMREYHDVARRQIDLGLAVQAHAR
nr:efflux RND transporter periplasmic adaptor subunit [Luteitalea pratensis]